MATQAPADPSFQRGSAGARIAREVSALQASLLAKLREEIPGDDHDQFAEAAQRLAEEFGSVTATAVDAPAAPRRQTSLL